MKEKILIIKPGIYDFAEYNLRAKPSVRLFHNNLIYNNI